MSGDNTTQCVRDTFASTDGAPQVLREVIDLIASYVVADLDPKKIREAYPSLRHGALVCRAWREAFQRRLCDVVRLENESQVCRFLKSGLVERYPIKDLCLLSPGHEAEHKTTGRNKRVCRSCVDIVNTVRGLQTLRGLPCYLPWDEEVVDKLKSSSFKCPTISAQKRLERRVGAVEYVVDDDDYDFDLALKPLLRENGANLEVLTISVMDWGVRDFGFVSALRTNIHLCPKLKELDLNLVYAELPGHLKSCQSLLAALPTTAPIKCLRICFAVESEYHIRSIVVMMKHLIQNENIPRLDSLCVRIVAHVKSTEFEVLGSSKESLDDASIVSKLTSVIEGSLWDDLRTLCDSVAINCVVKSVVISPYP
ncbi:BZ3500_MvSof-1268-A1-R1_Chr3-1g05504 [Microbotryum saponariae]|uniref:BZ3500_MvSof-1268-A1-R1_Chr3-1g05504 protein n=1 Tax=Microbotryum saponariae TaxID=289078 RepID=A0A2X0L1C3_9BASI|nr:BZ3500_MvSof-1268-A1-R1_Chr3-1g05504 [Microbotryum saponariae]SDA04695.1 BZ3501_MvSof-1269-A2-R1_Chr3-1g05175 [Microbotryum saponariae]